MRKDSVGHQAPRGCNREARSRLRPCSAWVSAKFVDQQVDADQQDPERKRDEGPRKIRAQKQQKECKSVTEQCDPTRRDLGKDNDCRCGHQEYPGHLDHVDVHYVVSKYPREMERYRS